MSVPISYARSEVLTAVPLKAQNYIPQDLNLQIFYGQYTALNFATKEEGEEGKEEEEEEEEEEKEEKEEEEKKKKKKKNAQLDCSKRMLKFTLIFTLKMLLHVSI